MGLLTIIGSTSSHDAPEEVSLASSQPGIIVTTDIQSGVLCVLQTSGTEDGRSNVEQDASNSEIQFDSNESAIHGIAKKSR